MPPSPNPDVGIKTTIVYLYCIKKVEMSAFIAQQYFEYFKLN